MCDIGNNNLVELMRMIEIIEEKLGRAAEKQLLPIQPGDVPATYADVQDLADAVGFKPATPLETALAASSNGIGTTIGCDGDQASPAT